MPRFIDLPTEQTTAVTDAILALLALGGVFYLRQIGQADPWKTNLWAAGFGLLALAAALGAIAHGFQMSAATNRLFWHPLNLALGLTVALFVAGVVYDVWGLAATHWALPAMVVSSLIFLTLTILRPGSFLIFITYEAVAMLFALGAYSWLALGGRLPGAGLMAAGVLVTMVAAGVQAGWNGQEQPLTLIWQFDQNGLYHLIQMVGVLLLLAGLRAALLSEGAIDVQKTF